MNTILKPIIFLCKNGYFFLLNLKTVNSITFSFFPMLLIVLLEAIW